MTLDQHLAVLLSAAQHVDSAVSKTCNVPGSTPWGDFKELYHKAWLGGAKGHHDLQQGRQAQWRLLTKGSVKEEVEEPEVAEFGLTCEFDPVTGARSCE